MPPKRPVARIMIIRNSGVPKPATQAIRTSRTTKGFEGRHSLTDADLDAVLELLLQVVEALAQADLEPQVKGLGAPPERKSIQITS
jgi:hypothetical protein